MKKFIMVIMIFTFAIVAVLLLKPKKNNNNTESVQPDKEEPVVLTWYLPFPGYPAAWDTEVARYITERTGVILDIRTPEGDGNQKLELMMSTNQLTDLVSVEWWQQPFGKLQDSEYVYALDELMDEMDSHKLIDYIGTENYYWWKQEDGLLYGIPTFFKKMDELEDGMMTGLGVMLVRQDIYEALGCPDMSTQDAFVENCKLAAAMDGFMQEEPMIPVCAGEYNASGWETVGAQVAGWFNALYLTEEQMENDYILPFLTENSHDMYRFINRLFREKLLLRENLLYGQEQINEWVAAGRPFVIVCQAWH